MSVDLSDRGLISVDLTDKDNGELGQLRELLARGNDIPSLPACTDFSKLTSLLRLDLSHNFLQELSATDVDSLPTTLEFLILHSQKVRAGVRLKGSLPANLGRLAELREVNINLNHIERLPESIGELVRLFFALAPQTVISECEILVQTN